VDKLLTIPSASASLAASTPAQAAKILSAAAAAAQIAGTAAAAAKVLTLATSSAIGSNEPGAASKALTVSASAALGGAWNIVHTTQQHQTSSTTNTITFPATTAGTMLIAVFNFAYGGTLTRNAALGAGWVLVKRQAKNTASVQTGGQVEIWKYPSNPGGITSATSTTGVVVDSCLTILEVAGLTASSNAGGTTRTGTTSTSVSVSSVGGNVVGDLVIVGCCAPQTSGSTNQAFTDTASYLTVGADFLLPGTQAASTVHDLNGTGTTGPQTDTITLGQTSWWAAAIALFS